jgi:hypothetical protein
MSAIISDVEHKEKLSFGENYWIEVIISTMFPRMTGISSKGRRQ